MPLIRNWPSTETVEKERPSVYYKTPAHKTQASDYSLANVLLLPECSTHFDPDFHLSTTSVSTCMFKSAEMEYQRQFGILWIAIFCILTKNGQWIVVFIFFSVLIYIISIIEYQTLGIEFLVIWLALYPRYKSDILKFVQIWKLTAKLLKLSIIVYSRDVYTDWHLKTSK